MTEASLNRVCEKIAQWPDGPIYAVMDGAFFDDLPRRLQDADFRSRPLFLEQSDPAMRRDGPHFAAVPRDRLNAFLSIPRITRRGVFWNAPGCEDMAFYRHLRGLTMARLPTRAAVEIYLQKKTRMAVYRHFDPGTVSITLPVMTPAQRARMFGPAHSLLLDAPEGVLEATRRQDWPKAEEGRLTFTRAQMDAISDAMFLRSRRAAVAFLRREIPEYARNASDAALWRFTEESERLARRSGLTTEDGFACFAWMRARTAGNPSSFDRVIERLAAERQRADACIQQLRENVLRQGLKALFS